TRQQVINVADLKAGIYFVKIKAEGGEVVKRFIKN
ncbi:MAG: T9SS type A sorting domain-containing protein, partial [Clostridia bacterium]|nr:T9SS type A sorting domain-containing protein [Clostridia bacterium]